MSFLSLLRSEDSARMFQGALLVLTEVVLHSKKAFRLTSAKNIDTVKDGLSILNKTSKNTEEILTKQRQQLAYVQHDYEKNQVRTWNSRAVPEGRTARAFGFGSLAFGLLAGGMGEAFSRVASDKPDRGTSPLFLNADNSERLAATLCRMRGAALKLGQMLSLQEESFLPAPLQEALDRVRQNADIMPETQLKRVIRNELGDDWEEKFLEFNFVPLAAASIGQVHRAILKNETEVAMKIQFPGVASSIDSDLDNLQMLANLTGIFPKGLFIENIIEVMKEELKEECDYIKEAQHQMKFKELISKHENRFYVPEVKHELSTNRILTSDWVSGVPVDKTKDFPQDLRNDIGRKLLQLSLLELFEFRYMQTDPNYSNYLYNLDSGRIGLIDFGATREYDKSFVDEYLRLVWAASNKDRQGILDSSIKLGFLTGGESLEMVNAHVNAGLETGKPFQENREFDFRKSMISSKVKKYGTTFARERLTPPPREIYSLHRRLSGAYMTCIKLGAIFNCRELLEEAYSNYKW